MAQLKLLLLSTVVLTLFASCERGSELSREVAALEAPGAAEPAPVAYPPGRWRLVGTAQLHEVVLWVSHIVIRHREARSFDPCFSFADWHSDRVQPTRSRQEALAIAKKIAEEAEGTPEHFAELAARYSEDVGTQS